MGNSQTQTKKESKKNIQVPHPAFQTAQLVRNSLGKQLIQIGASLKSQKDYVQWTKNYKRIPKTTSMLFPEQTRYQNKGCCGSSGIAHIQYQRFQYILKEEIEIRRTNNQGHFQQNELWLLLYTLVDSAEMFHIRKLKVGDIRPLNVFMNSEGEIKVANQFSYPYGATNYQQNITDPETVTYLAPQQVKDLQFGKMKDTNDPLVVESFSIGLTVLDAALLASSQKFYETVGLFGFDRLNESLRLLAHVNYSTQLTHIITKMCDSISENRLKANEVLKMLKPFSKQILTKKPFDLTSLPSSQQNQPINNAPNGQSRVSVDNSKRQDDYKFIPGVVFDSKDDGLMQSSLKHGKQVIIKTQRIANTYEIPQKGEMRDLNCPVQTGVYYPPITIQLPPAIQRDIAHLQNQV